MKYTAQQFCPYEMYCITRHVQLWLFSAVMGTVHTCQTSENGELVMVMPIKNDWYGAIGYLQIKADFSYLQAGKGLENERKTKCCIKPVENKIKTSSVFLET